MVSNPRRPVIHPVAPGSWMEYALNDAQLIYGKGFVPPYAPVSTREGDKASLKISDDLGNGESKVSLIDPYSYRLRCVKKPTTFKWTQDLTTGSYQTTYRILKDTRMPLTSREQSTIDGGGSPFPLDAYTIGDGGEALPMGESEVKLATRQYRLYVWATLANAMIQTGYVEGEYNIVLALGLRNDEMSLDEMGESQMKPAIFDIVKTYVGTTVKIEVTTMERTGKKKDRATRILQFHITDIIPYAQTLGAFQLWYNGLDGKPAQKTIKRAVFVDLGAGDGHILEVDCTDADNPRTTGMRNFAGTIYLCRGLEELIKKEFPAARGSRMDAAALQNALKTGSILISGVEYDVSDLRDQTVQIQGPKWIDEVLGTTLIDRNSFYFFGGGGVLVKGVDGIVTRKMVALEKELGLNYYVNNAKITVETNSFGGNAMLDAIFRAEE